MTHHTRMGLVLLSALVLALLPGCSSDSQSAVHVDDRSTVTTSGASAPSPSVSSTDAAPLCPFNIPNEWEGGDCAGALRAGPNVTHSFTPTVTYRVPAGWNNVKDFPGNYVLLPPGADLPGINAGTADSVYLAANVYALNRRCAHDGQITREPPRVGHTAAALAHELATRPGVVGSEPKPVEIGHLTGYVVDLRIDPDWTRRCFFTDRPTVPMIGGLPPTDLIHVLQPGFTLRYYFLDHAGATLAIEVQDVRHDDRKAYARVIRTFRFG